MPERFYKAPFSVLLRLVNAGKISVPSDFFVKLLSQFGARKIDEQEFRKQIRSLLDEYVRREGDFDEDKWSDEFLEAIPQRFFEGLLSASSSGKLISAFCKHQLSDGEFHLFLQSNISQSKKKVREANKVSHGDGHGPRRKCA